MHVIAAHLDGSTEGWSVQLIELGKKTLKIIFTPLELRLLAPYSPKKKNYTRPGL